MQSSGDGVSPAQVESPSGMSSACPVMIFNASTALPSILNTILVPPREKAMSPIQLLLNVCLTCPVVVSHARIVWLFNADTRVFPSGKNLILRTELESLSASVCSTFPVVTFHTWIIACLPDAEASLVLDSTRGQCYRITLILACYRQASTIRL